MRNRFVHPSALLFFLLMFTSGCQGCGPTVPDTPDGTVTTVASELKKENPEILWKAMPPSYHSDVNELVQLMAKEMDVELWNKGFSVATKVTDVIREKKTFILGSAMLEATNVNQKELEKNWDGVVALLEALTKSELSDLEKLKQFDGEKFLAGTGKNIFGKVLQLRNLGSGDAPVSFEGVEVKKIKEEGNEAVLEVTFDDQTRELKMTRVDGRWIPSDMAKEWDESIKEAREVISKMAKEDLPKNKPMMMVMLGGIEAGLDQLKNAKSQKEFDTILQGLLMSGRI